MKTLKKIALACGIGISLYSSFAVAAQKNISFKCFVSENNPICKLPHTTMNKLYKTSVFNKIYIPPALKISLPHGNLHIESLPPYDTPYIEVKPGRFSNSTLYIKAVLKEKIYTINMCIGSFTTSGKCISDPDADSKTVYLKIPYQTELTSTGMEYGYGEGDLGRYTLNSVHINTNKNAKLSIKGFKDEYNFSKTAFYIKTGFLWAESLYVKYAQVTHSAVLKDATVAKIEGTPFFMELKGVSAEIFLDHPVIKLSPSPVTSTSLLFSQNTDLSQMGLSSDCSSFNSHLIVANDEINEKEEKLNLCEGSVQIDYRSARINAGWLKSIIYAEKAKDLYEVIQEIKSVNTENNQRMENFNKKQYPTFDILTTGKEWNIKEIEIDYNDPQCLLKGGYIKKVERNTWKFQPYIQKQITRPCFLFEPELDMDFREIDTRSDMILSGDSKIKDYSSLIVDSIKDISSFISNSEPTDFLKNEGTSPVILSRCGLTIFGKADDVLRQIAKAYFKTCDIKKLTLDIKAEDNKNTAGTFPYYATLKDDKIKIKRAAPILKKVKIPPLIIETLQWKKETLGSREQL